MEKKMISAKGAFSISLFIFSILMFASASRGSGEIDPSFDTSAYGATNGSVNVVRMQADGKILVGGNFTVVQGYARSGLVRLNSDGTVDTTFNPPDFFDGNGIGGTIHGIAFQSSGKIIVTGGFFLTAVFQEIPVVRLNPDGSIDPTFSNPPTSFQGTFFDVEVQPDDKIVVGGPTSIGYVVRFNANGLVDSSFTPLFLNDYVKDIALQADGKVLYAVSSPPFQSGGGLGRLNSNGSVDSMFAPPNTNNVKVETVKILPSGKFLMGGDFTTVNGFPVGRIALINTDGSVDLSFNLNNPGANGIVNDIALRADGKIVIVGGFAFYNSASRRRIVQLNADGTPDTSFLDNTVFTSGALNTVGYQTDNKVVVGADPNFSGTQKLARFNTDGTIDPTFNPLLDKNLKVYKIYQLSNGQIMICGDFLYIAGFKRNGIARLNSDGTVDPTFVPYFNDSTQQIINAIAFQSDNKMIIGSTSGFNLKRLNFNGSQDVTFTTPSITGVVYDVGVLTTGQVIAVGAFTVNSNTRFIARFNSTGGLESFPAIMPNSIVYKLHLEADGKAFIGGSFTQIGTFFRGKVARYNSDGSLDTVFNPPGGANSTVYDLDVQGDGKVVLGGAFSALNGSTNHIRVGRLNADGTLDTSFIPTANGDVLGIKVQPDGKVLVSGLMSTLNGTAHNRIGRLNSDGSIDTAFTTFANVTVWDVALQSNGKILLGGEFTRVNGVSKVRAARLLNTTAPIRPLFDYDGDGKSDVSVFRPSTNRWYVFKSSDSTVSETTFGIAGDVPVPADFDGDGKTDLAIFRPSSGDWWSLSSLNGAQIFAHWGANGDIPRPSDFDGDGRADYVVFRPSDNFWYRISSGNGASSNGAFGLAGDKPVTGDFDGDGKSDKAIYRPSTGDWWYQSSLNGAQLATHWGISTDIPAPADFDGDGKTDFAVYRPSTGVWYVINSSNGSFLIMAFGIAEDKPVPADYDGDGKADIAVFRPSTGTWYQMKTTAGFSAQQFGISTDIPTENAFVP
jgi:uncharacterized delta-60 repeat protein